MIQLDKSRKKVLKYASLELPVGTIENYQIKNPLQITEIIKQAFKNLAIKEKAVGIVIPEFSTFSKSMTLPHLTLSELDEAVRWQFNDFWPSSEESMIMDWKIVNKTKDNYQILSVAISQKLLMAYVKAVAEAGLFPITVETPSLSLTRISDGDSTAKLIIYANFNEVILAIAKKEEILTSSVFKNDNDQNIFWTVMQMIKHYQQADIQRITIGGLQISQELLNKLHAAINKPIIWIQPKVIGLDNKQIQEFLIPIALQYKDPAEPASEKTINLLPPEWVSYYQKKQLKFEVLSLLLISSLVIWGCFLLTAGTYLNLLRQINIYQNLPLEAVAQPEENLSKIKQANILADKINKINQNSLLPQEIISKIKALKPEGVRFFSYKIDLESGKIVLNGQSTNRQNLIDLKKKFEEAKDFSQVEIPLSYLEKEENINFEITLFYGQGLEKRARGKIKI